MTEPDRLDGTEDWRSFIDARGTGDHVVAWTSSTSVLRDLSARFLEDGLARADHVLVVLPRDDLGAIRDFRYQGEDFAALEASGRLQLLASEDFAASIAKAPERASQTVDGFLRPMISESMDQGRDGVRILGRVAPLFFERGEDGPAVGIEEAVQSLRARLNVLCLYRTSAVAGENRLLAAHRISQAHTHSVLELPGGPVVCATRSSVSR